MKMKTILSTALCLVLIASMLFLFAACGKKDKGDATTGEEPGVTSGTCTAPVPTSGEQTTVPETDAPTKSDLDRTEFY